MFSKADIEKYFIAEKQESLLFLGIGIAALVLSSVFFFFLKTPFYRGAALPLLMVGLLLGVVGFTVYRRSDGDRIRNVYAYDMNPGELKDKELPRMKKVMKNFVIYRYVEIALLLAGIGLFIYFRKYDPGARVSIGAFWKGMGLTLAIMAMLTLLADYFAEKRAALYTKQIESFVSR